MRIARVDGRPGHFETGGYILGQPANDHRRGRVEQHHVALWPLLTVEYPAQDTRIVIRVAAFEGLGCDCLQTKIPRMNLARTNLSASKLSDLRPARSA